MANYFKYKGRLEDEQSQSLVKVIIKNSAAVLVGQAVKSTAGFAEAVGAGDKVLGIVVGIETADGLPLSHIRATGKYDGTYVPGGPGVEKYTAASNNQTVKQVKVVVNTSKDALYANDADGDLALAQVYTFYDVTSGAVQIDQSTTGAHGQFQLVDLDPDGDGDASKGTFRIAESQLDPFAQATG